MRRASAHPAYLMSSPLFYANDDTPPLLSPAYLMSSSLLTPENPYMSNTVDMIRSYSRTVQSVKPFHSSYGDRTDCVQCFTIFTIRIRATVLDNHLKIRVERYLYHYYFTCPFLSKVHSAAHVWMDCDQIPHFLGDLFRPGVIRYRTAFSTTFNIQMMPGSERDMVGIVDGGGDIYRPCTPHIGVTQLIG